jgi:polyhydroxyalkanoate synthesis regulator protein
MIFYFEDMIFYFEDMIFYFEDFFEKQLRTFAECDKKLKTSVSEAIKYRASVESVIL